MLAEHVEATPARRVAVQGAGAHGLQRRLALQHLEAVGRDQEGAARLLQAVVGAAQALQQAADPLGRADLDDLIDRGPVDAEIERAGGDHGAQGAARHGGLDLAALLDRQAAVVQGDLEALVVEVPQGLEDDLRLGAGVDEDQGGLGALEALVDLGEGVHRHMPRPGHMRLALEDGDLRLGAAVLPDHTHRLFGRFLTRGEPAPQMRFVVDRGREADPAQARRDAPEPRHGERQQVAALAVGQRVQLIDDDAVEAGEDLIGVVIGQQQRQGLRRGQQHVGRLAPLALALGLRRVAGAGLDLDAEAHVADRGAEVALDIDGERLERRDVERVQACLRFVRQGQQAGQEAGQGLAATGRRDQQRRLAGLGRGDHLQLMAVGLPALRGEPVPEARRQAGEGGSLVGSQG